jgi:hypothetical protein
MLDQNDLWLLEEELPIDEPADALLTMPEIRQWVDPDRDDEELGLRSILERPEALSQAWRHTMHAEWHQRSSKHVKRPVDVLRAA